MKYSVNKKWKVYGEAQWRFDNILATSTPFFLEAGGRRKINKIASIKLQYRYTWISGERNTQRLAIDGRFKWKIFDKKYNVYYRTRAQLERVNFNGQIISDWRNKFGVERKFSKKFVMYVNYELCLRVLKLKSFVRIDPPRLTGNRYTLGAKYQFKKNEIGVFYRLDQALNSRNEFSHIVGLGISRKLN
jgi:hypothetical protein